MRGTRWAAIVISLLGAFGLAGSAYSWTRMNYAEIWVSEAPEAPLGGNELAAARIDQTMRGREEGGTQAASYVGPARAGAPLTAVLRQAEGGAADAGRAGEADAQSACPTLQDVYAVIARLTEGKEIGEIIGALEAISADQQGVSSATSALGIALRAGLGLNAAHPPCESTLAAAHEALRLARLAAADGQDATAAIGQRPAVTSTFSALPYGSPEGAGGSGYSN